MLHKPKVFLSDFTMNEIVVLIFSIFDHFFPCGAFFTFRFFFYLIKVILFGFPTIEVNCTRPRKFLSHSSRDLKFFFMFCFVGCHVFFLCMFLFIDLHVFVLLR